MCISWTEHLRIYSTGIFIGHEQMTIQGAINWLESSFPWQGYIASSQSLVTNCHHLLHEIGRSHLAVQCSPPQTRYHLEATKERLSKVCFKGLHESDNIKIRIMLIYHIHFTLHDVAYFKFPCQPLRKKIITKEKPLKTCHVKSSITKWV